jgi:chemotaxis protein MotB
VPQEKLVGISDYFQPTIGIRDNAGQDLKGSVGNQDDGIQIKPASAPGVVYGAPPSIDPAVQAPQAPDVEIEDDGDEIRLSQTEAEAVEAELEKKRFESIKNEIERAVESDASLAEFKQNLKIDQTQEGLRIQITDLEGMSMFELGSSTLRADVQPLMAKLTDIITKVDNKIAIIGHTDSKAYKGVRTNWDLSAERANASRQFLTTKGLSDNRIYRIEGRADKEHFDIDPDSPKNRRISIILLKKSITSRKNYED